MEIIIKITGEDIINRPEVMESVKALSMAVSGNNTTAKPIQPTGIPTTQMQTQVASTQAAQNPIPAAIPAQVAQNPISAAAPTAQPAAYTLEQLSLAAAPLMDAGKTEALIALLQSFGVQTLQQLPYEKYNDFAVAIRGMGAQI